MLRTDNLERSQVGIIDNNSAGCYIRLPFLSILVELAIGAISSVGRAADS